MVFVSDEDDEEENESGYSDSEVSGGSSESDQEDAQVENRFSSVNDRSVISTLPALAKAVLALFLALTIFLISLKLKHIFKLKCETLRNIFSLRFLVEVDIA